MTGGTNLNARCRVAIDASAFSALAGPAHGTEAASLQVIKEHRQDDQ